MLVTSKYVRDHFSHFIFNAKTEIEKERLSDNESIESIERDFNAFARALKV